jgi:hypothetical protein
LVVKPLWQKEPVICKDSTIKLVAEVVSTNWQDDYARKVEEYAFLKIAEYWIVDFRGLGVCNLSALPSNLLSPSASWLMEFTSSNNIAWESRFILTYFPIYNCNLTTLCRLKILEFIKNSVSKILGSNY